MEIFLFTYIAILTTLMFLITFIPLVNSNYKKQYKELAAESDYVPVDRHQKL